MTEPIYLSPPDVTEAEEQALVRALRSGWIAPLGPEVDAFESELADSCGREHCVALSSGTAALHLGLLGLDVGAGDVVLTSTMTFAATANAIIYTGAEPVFVDCDTTGNLNPDLLAEAFDALTEAGERVVAVVPVDLIGKVVDHERIDSIAADYGAVVVSDAAESLGARRDGRPAGAFGRAAALSFNGNKIITTSGGGALVSDDADLIARARYLATQARQPVVHYEHTDIGYNYRLSNLLAAVGRAQLARLEGLIDRRRALRVRYRELFAGIAGVSMFGDPAESADGATRDNYWLTSVLIEPQIAGFTRDELREYLAAEGIEARPLWKPMHQQPVFASARSFVDGTSEGLFAQGLSLPSGSGLTDAQVGRISDAITAFLGSAR